MAGETPAPHVWRQNRASYSDAELSRRGSSHPGRAALAYLARLRTAATNAELAPVLGLSRAESVPNLTRRFAGLLAENAGTRDQLRRLEERLDGSRLFQMTRK